MPKPPLNDVVLCNNNLLQLTPLPAVPLYVLSKNIILPLAVLNVVEI